MSREARSLTTLRTQVDTAYPKRSKVSDGGTADARHLKAGTSDHIPDRDGVFHARDFTHDPDGGFDSYAFAERMLAAQDVRLKYVISAGRIGSGPAGPQPGTWRKYTGENQHRHHAHISVVSGPNGEDARPWAGVTAAPTKPTVTLAHSRIDSGNSGEDDDMTPDDRKLLEAVNGKLDNLLGQFGYTVENGTAAWRGVDVWDGSKRRLSLLDLLRETHRELMQRIPNRAPSSDTLLGHVLNIARKTGADGR